MIARVRASTRVSTNASARARASTRAREVEIIEKFKK